MFGFDITLNTWVREQLVYSLWPWHDTLIDIFPYLYWTRMKGEFPQPFSSCCKQKHFFTIRMIWCLYPWKKKKKKACWFYQRLDFPGHLHVATSLTFLIAIASLVDQVINLNWLLLMAWKVTWVTCRYTLIWWLPSGFLVMMTTQLWFLSCNSLSSIRQASKPQQTAKAISL